MRYVKVEQNGAPAWGVIDGEVIRLLERPPYRGVELTGVSTPLDGAKLLAPCEQGCKFVCLGKNYYEHAIEMGEGVPAMPMLFIKPSTCANDPEGVVYKPACVKRLDYEGELALVIGRKATKVAAADAMDYILGWTCLNDVTARDIQKAGGPWARGKGMDGFAPLGPVVTDEGDPGDLGIVTRLNGRTVQSGRTSAFMCDIAHTIEYITSTMTLLPGDIVATGTPEGVAPMADGDVVEVEIEGIGTLRSTIKFCE